MSARLLGGRATAADIRRAPVPRQATFAPSRDVGITRTDSGLVGDVHPGATQLAGWIVPMPAGVGPMTRAMPLAHVVEAAERNANAV